MPAIPVLEGPRVESRPLPAPQSQGTSPAAFGAAAGQGLQEVGGLLQRAADEERDKQDAARLTAVQPQLDGIEHTLLFDPKSGALNQRGFDALPTYDTTLKAFDEQTGKLMDSLANDRQKEAFGRMRAQRRASIGNTLENHTRQEVARADAASTQAAVDSAANMGVTYYNDPARRSQELKRGLGLIQSYATRAGVPKEAADEQAATFVSNLHAGVIERALQNGQASMARDYLDEYRDQIAGDKIGRLEEAVQQGGTLADAFAATDRIVGTAKNRSDALAQVREIKDPEVRQRAQAEVNQYYSEQEAAQREAENHLFDQWSARLEQVKGINRLKQEMGADWLRLDAQGRSALESRAAAIAKGPDVRTDDRVYTEFMLKSPSQMAAVNPLKDLRPYLDDGDYQHAVALVAEARRGGGETTPHLTEVTTVRDQVMSLAKDLQLVPASDPPSKWTPDQSAQFNALQRSVQARLQAFEVGQGGKKASPVERQAIIDAVARETVSVQSKHLGIDWLAKDPTVPVAALTTDQEGRAYVPFEVIPAEHSAALGNLLSSASVKSSNANVERLYARWLIETDGIPNPQWDVFTQYLADHPDYVREAVK